MLALVEGLGGKPGLGLLGDMLGPGLPGDELGLPDDGLALLGDGLGLVGGKLGVVLLGDGLGLVGDGLGLGLVGDGLGLLGDGLELGLGLLGGGLVLGGGLGLLAAGRVVEDAQAVGLGLAVVVALITGLVGAVARTGCFPAQLAEFGCW